jgi:hypothetical protein
VNGKSNSMQLHKGCFLPPWKAGSIQKLTLATASFQLWLTAAPLLLL